MNKNFQLIILAAGKGSRLKSYTKKKPKSLIQLGKESILLQQIRIINLFDKIKKKNFSRRLSFFRIQKNSSK